MWAARTRLVSQLQALHNNRLSRAGSTVLAGRIFQGQERVKKSPLASRDGLLAACHRKQNSDCFLRFGLTEIAGKFSG
jgi:hypothetical protein